MLSKQQLGNILWGIADTGLRGKVEDYKAYILSLLFFKRLSDNYQWESENLIREFEERYKRKPNAKQLARLQEEGHDFLIPTGCFWSDVRAASLSEKNEALDHAVNEIADKNPPLKGIINAVRWNEPAPDGSGNKKLDPEVVTGAINYLDPVKLDNASVSPDVLGDAYEYLIKRFADENKSGTTAGQFYTPPEVVEIIVRTIQPEPDSTFYDPTCGSGGFLIKSAKFVKEKTGTAKSIRLFGQESVWNTWAIANINMILHGLDAQVRQGNTIKDPKFLDGGAVRRFDRVGANFPFSEENWWLNGTPKKDAKGRAILKKNGSPQMQYPEKDEFGDPFNRLAFGVPPFSTGDFVFLQHIVSSLNDGGRAGVVCSQGVFFRGQPEKTEADLIEAIVVLPDNLFYGTTLPGGLVFFNRSKPVERKNKVLMVYAARAGWYKEAPDQNVLLPHDVLRILIQLLSWGDGETAKRILPKHKIRMYGDIQERLDFEKSEIELRYKEEVAELARMQEKLQDKTLKKGERERLEKRLVRLDEEMEKMKSDLAEADVRSAQEREAVGRVEAELLEMFGNPDLRKRYFAIVDKVEIEENEFNLNIPRYVDTFEPEEEINVNSAASQLSCSLAKEAEALADVEGFLKKLSTQS
jgi:type I restriction enzyme M protein